MNNNKNTRVNNPQCWTRNKTKIPLASWFRWFFLSFFLFTLGLRNKEVDHLRRRRVDSFLFISLYLSLSISFSSLPSYLPIVSNSLLSGHNSAYQNKKLHHLSHISHVENHFLVFFTASSPNHSFESTDRFVICLAIFVRRS
jgi:hypothetical protein